MRFESFCWSTANSPQHDGYAGDDARFTILAVDHAGSNNLGAQAAELLGQRPKPVIGKHGKAWVCLHECPKGEAPGIIPDIKAWAKANNWSIPKQPKRQPMFPDLEFKRGEFVD